MATETSEKKIVCQTGGCGYVLEPNKGGEFCPKCKKFGTFPEHPISPEEISRVMKVS